MACVLRRGPGSIQARRCRRGFAVVEVIGVDALGDAGAQSPVMALPTTPLGWLDAVSWHLRGLFATEANRRIGFRARALWQPAEIEARRGLARDLATELQPGLRVDPAAGHRVLPPAEMPSLDEVCAIG